MKFLKSRVFIVCLILAIALTLIPTMLAAFGGTDLLRSALGTVAKPFTMCASGIANAFNGFTEVFTDYDALKKENEELRAELEEYKNKEYDEELLREHNAWLSKYINLHNSSPELNLCDARIISREANNTSISLTLNKGSIHGIKRNMPVITADGLLGHVSEAGLDWCRVVTVLEPSSAVGVYTERGDVHGVLEGDATLMRDGLCSLRYIESDSNIIPADRVYTAGDENSIYPSGLLVGTVEKIDVDKATGEIVATLRPAIDFTSLSDIRDVMVIIGYKSN